MPIQKCSFCDRHFNRVEHLLRHVRTHTKEKPFKCENCGKHYAREDTLVRHVKSHCAGRRNRMALSEASTELGEDIMMRNEDQSPEENTIITTPDDMTFLDTRETCHSELQTTTILASSPLQSTADFSVGANMWDFANIDFMDDFQLWTVNNGLLANGVHTAGTTRELQNLQFHNPQYFHNIHVTDRQASPVATQLPAVFDMRNIWFTKIQRSEESLQDPPFFQQSSTSISQSGLSPREPELVDEECRRGLTKALIHQFPQEHLLPSSEFLNLCLRRYLKCFNPIFPLIHAGTFQRTPANGLLLISMASMGCLFLGSQAAVQRGRRIFESLNKAILTSWDNVLGRTSDEIVALIQAAIIGQTFAMLSGDAKHFAIFDTYHGSLISFARREKMFEASPATTPPENLSEDGLEVAWKKWARREEMTRISLALQIHDAELSALLYRESFLKHVTSDNSWQGTVRAFSAPTASKWAHATKEDATLHAARAEMVGKPQVGDAFTAYVKLEGIGVMIVEDRRQGCLDQAAFDNHQKTLLRWHESYVGRSGREQPSQLCLIALWHWTYMALLVDFDKLESAIGRDGPEAAQSAIAYVSTWASTPNASRCMLHAFLIQKQVQYLSFDDIPAIHLPRILFSAAIAWHCYIRYGRGNDAFDSSVQHFDTSSPEFSVIGFNSLNHLSCITSLSWSQGAESSIRAATLCELGGLLQRMNQWGIAGKLASIVARLMDGEPQGV